MQAVQPAGKVAILNGQSIGYWGKQDDRDLLAAILNAPSCDLSITPIGISASGRGLDAWARLSGNELILGREIFGRTPLLWTIVGDRIWFASHLRLLLPAIDTHEIDLAGFYGYSCFSYVPTPHTPLRGISAVPAGTELRFVRVGDKIETIELLPPTTKRWSSGDRVQIADEATAISQLQELLQAAISRQIEDLAARPVGVLLSGGLDSAIAAALLVKNGINVRAYTLDFGADGISETPYAQMVAAHLDIPCIKVSITPQRVRQAIDNTARALDLPFGDGVTVPLYLLCQAAREDVAVIFNGEGGDQLFAGWTNKPTIAASIYGGDRHLDRYYLDTFHRLYNYESQAFQPQIVTQVRSIDPRSWIANALDPVLTPELLHRLRRASLMLKGAQNIHPRATNLASWHGLQVRSIFCDLSLAEWTFGIAGTLYLQGACEKYILKRAVEDLLPAEIVWRNKRGMGVPLNAWLLGELWADLGDWLNPRSLQAEGLWQPDLGLRLSDGRFAGAIQGRRIGEILWSIVMWERWRTEVLGDRSSDRAWLHPFLLPRSIWQMRQRWDRLRN